MPLLHANMNTKCYTNAIPIIYAIPIHIPNLINIKLMYTLTITINIIINIIKVTTIKC